MEKYADQNIMSLHIYKLYNPFQGTRDTALLLLNIRMFLLSQCHTKIPNGKMKFTSDRVVIDDRLCQKTIKGNDYKAAQNSFSLRSRPLVVVCFLFGLNSQKCEEFVICRL